MNTNKLTMLLAVQLVLATPIASAEYSNISGTNCEAATGSGGNVTRSNDRLYNKSTSNVWVACSIERNATAQGGGQPDYGYINVYFASGASSSTAVSCSLREIYFTGSVNAVTTNSTTNNNPGTNHVQDMYFTLNNSGVSNYSYLAVRCLLPPKTGIQSIDWSQQ